MDFRILGPVEVWQDGEAVPISAPRQRAVLAGLLVRPGAVVTTGTLVQDLWGATPPRSASVTVRNYVQRLRRGLPEPVLESAPSGYRLRIRPEQLDVHRFGTLVDSARAEPDPGRSAELFEQALGLWRGTPLQDLGDVPVRALQAPKLEEQYLAALEDSIEVGLRLGRQGELVARLTELTAEYPLRERLCRQLMLALYRTGRAAEALGAYRRIRGTLVSELGMEPGSELRRLEQAILREDPELDAEGEVDRPGRAPVPDALPAGTATFVGRAAELADLRARFARPGASQPVCFVHGQGGSGKSTLAIHTARELAADFPDGVLYVDLHGATPGAQPLSAAEVLQVLLRTLGGADIDPRQDLATIVRTYRTRLRGRRVLVVLDNAASKAHALPAIPDEPGCGAIVTSRSLIAGPEGATRVHLDAFGTEEAVELLRRLIGSSAVDSDPAAAARLADLCGRLPLALRLIASRAALRPHWPLSSWVDLLADERRRLDQLRHQDSDIRASFAVGIEQLEADGSDRGRDARRLFDAFGLIDGCAGTLGLACALTGWRPERAEPALDHLVDVGLLASPEPGRYEMYDLITLLARERAEFTPEAERAERLGAAMRWYLAAARHCCALATGARELPGMPDREPVDARDTVRFESCEPARRWLDREIGTLVALLRQAARERLPGCVAALTTFARALTWYFNSSMRWTERSQLGEAMLTLAHDTGDTRLEAAGLAQLCVTEAQRGNLDEADRLGKRAADLLADAGDADQDRLMLLSNQSGVAMLRGEPERAAALSRVTLEHATAAGHDHLVASSQCNLAMIAMRGGSSTEAASRLREAVRINRRIGHVTNLVVTLNSLMSVYAATGSHHEVLARSVEALELHGKLGGGYLAAEGLLQLARSLHELGRTGEARERHREAREHLAGVSSRERIGLADLLESLEFS
ncbi:AfsR/SARP family transcriptional regulator [Amycolatopsis cihanbeyliensis]|uniref:DNA-binding SARP family transcriptional activator n=1 Tax=Amycolatopsis cihanbeyliensis TaxID=1128664 RepID=A0A542DP24_AMYCI|nr:AfsR/SARP family transcriptional regulator [Amycolatopsis cihanbeyliensis]TQJ04853.1 DNA-binding SARP family transcriptional activator [Amycolatopsis cihanbeyliensis]